MAGKVLIVYAHSSEKSYTHAVLDAAVAGFSCNRNPEDLTVVDLYRDGFEPRLVVNETHRRRDLDKVEYTARYRRLIGQADLIVFIYPVWWGGFPAILKGFIDRTFVSGLAYSFTGKRKRAVFPEGLLRGKQAHFFYTLDSPWLVAALDPGWFGNYFSVFWYCGFGPIKRHFLSRLKLTSDRKRERWLRRVEFLCSRL